MCFKICYEDPLVTDGPTTAYSERFPFLIRQRTPFFYFPAQSYEHVKQTYATAFELEFYLK